MIVTATRHGRTGRDVRQLAAHLGRDEEARVVLVGGVPLSLSDDALRYMEALRDGSRASVAMHHITLSPAADLTDAQRDGMVLAVLAAMGAEDHAHVLWEHRKDRAEPGGSPRHWHLVVSHVGPDGRALDDGHSYLRLEAAARVLETAWGHAITRSRRAASVAAALDATHPDVAAAVRAAQPPELPRSATSSVARAGAARKGVDLSTAQVTVRTAWASSDSPQAFRAALAEEGFAIVPGARPNVWVVRIGGVDVGAVDRIVRESRVRVADRMKHAAIIAPDTAQSVVEGVRDQLAILCGLAGKLLQQAVVDPLVPEELVVARAAARAAKKTVEDAFYDHLDREREAATVLREPRPSNIWGLPSRRAREWDRAAAAIDEIEAARVSAREARARADKELARLERAVAPMLALDRDRRDRQATRAREDLLLLQAAEACLVEIPAVARNGVDAVLREAWRYLDRTLPPRSPAQSTPMESTHVPSAMARSRRSGFARHGPGGSLPRP